MIGNWRFKAENMYKMCFKKKKIKTFEYAVELAKKYDQHVYLCPICSHYHLTSRKEPLNNMNFLY